MRRKLLGISQERLAEALGLTFQQVQKYERGANRVSASKLFEIAKALQTPVAFFFDGLGPTADGRADPASSEFVHNFLMSSEGLELAASFPRITKSRVRRRLVDLVKVLADDSTEPAEPSQPS